MMTKEQARGEARTLVENRAGEIIALSRFVHDHPEIGFEEKQSSAAVASFLERGGFRVRLGCADMETAFFAAYDSGLPGPVIAFLCEYDALPGMGHACGHNIIASASAGAAIAAKQIAEQCGGRILVLGTPAEEGCGGGKPRMYEAGLFDGVDCALMVHPGNETGVEARSMAANAYFFTFHGKSAHAGVAPHAGRNALDAAALTYMAVNCLRATLKDNIRINSIVTKGGENQGTIPETTQLRYLIRATTRAYLDEMQERIFECVRGAAIAAGCTYEIEPIGLGYDEFLNNATLNRLMYENFTELGEKCAAPLDDTIGGGATDIGNISLRLPAIHPHLFIGDPTAVAHNPGFACAAGLPRGHESAVTGATALAMTAAELLTDPDLVAAMREDFRTKRER